MRSIYCACIFLQPWLCTRRRLLRNGECCASYSSRVQCSSVRLYCPCGEICFAAITKSITINSKHFSRERTRRKQSARGQRGPPPRPSLIVRQKAVVTRRHVFCCYTFTAPRFTSAALRLHANSSNRETIISEKTSVSPGPFYGSSRVFAHAPGAFRKRRNWDTPACSVSRLVNSRNLHSVDLLSPNFSMIRQYSRKLPTCNIHLLYKQASPTLFFFKIS